MKYAEIEYGLQKDEPGKWRWRIYPKAEAGPKVIGETIYPSREEAEKACIAEIREGLESAKRT